MRHALERKHIIALKTFGFTANESKAYLTLLQTNPATGYEISGKSGIPRSAIYEILKRLETNGLVSAIDTNPTRYIPLPPDQLFEYLESKFSGNMLELKASLKNIDTEMEVGDLWNIRGYDNMIEKSRALIQNAQQNIYISCWNSEYNKLMPDLRQAEARGIKIVVFSFCNIQDKIGQVFCYNFDSSELEKMWNKKILIVVDRTSALLGGVENLPTNKVAWTKNSAIVSIALNYIILDLTLLGQRFKLNVSSVLAEMLEGDIRVLDDLLIGQQITSNKS
jgi:HTH-type transcriptional regulator, sugar sensing transcriptional regulator